MFRCEWPSNIGTASWSVAMPWRGRKSGKKLDNLKQNLTFLLSLTSEKHWFMTYAGEIRHGDYCLDYPGNFLITYLCHGQKGNQVRIILFSSQFNSIFLRYQN